MYVNVFMHIQYTRTNSYKRYVKYSDGLPHAVKIAVDIQPR